VRGADRRKAGLGLGLAIAEVIVSAHGGRVEIGRSESGGARVALVIPQGGPR
jgi:K+-sensing histidine kinase KdpD